MPTPLPRVSYRPMTRADFGWEGSGSSRARTASGAAEAAPPLRALRIAVPLLLAHRCIKLLPCARSPPRLSCRPLRTCHAQGRPSQQVRALRRSVRSTFDPSDDPRSRSDGRIGPVRATHRFPSLPAVHTAHLYPPGPVCAEICACHGSGPFSRLLATDTYFLSYFFNGRTVDVAMWPVCSSQVFRWSVCVLMMPFGLGMRYTVEF